MVIDRESVILDMFALFLSRCGYPVTTHSSPYFCPVFEQSHEECHGPSCADIIIVDCDTSDSSEFGWILRLSEMGCRVPDRNKAIISTSLNGDMKRAAGIIGCVCFEKPFRLSTVTSWIQRCETYLQA